MSALTLRCEDELLQRVRSGKDARRSRMHNRERDATAQSMALAWPTSHIGDVSQSPKVSWRVNGMVGGSAELGTISLGGLYTAPAIIPSGDSVVVTAVLDADTTIRATSTVFFLPDHTSKDYVVTIPRVIDVS